MFHTTFRDSVTRFSTLFIKNLTWEFREICCFREDIREKSICKWVNDFADIREIILLWKK